MRWGILAWAAVLVFGCAQPEVPSGKFYRIYAEAAGTAYETPRLDGVLIVRPFLADGLVSERLLIYGDDSQAGTLQQYHYHAWTESPTRMLQEQLVSYLRAANVASQVITPDIRVDGRYELSGKIKRLEQIRGAEPTVVVEVEFGLLEPRAGQLVMVKSYKSQIPLADETIEVAVGGFDQAVSQIFAQFVQDLAGV